MPKKERTTIFNNHKKRGYLKFGRDFRQGNQWKKTRAVYFSNNPICEVHKIQGLTSPAHDIDHLIPPKYGGAKYRADNLCALNGAVHDRKTSAENKENAPLFDTVKTRHGLIPANKTQAIKALKIFLDG
jgi:5-methylcytosine-specific restriction endonuclease McrA